MVGDRIKKLRESKKLSGKKFSESVGISPQFLSQIEHNKTQPSQPLVMLIEKTYGVSLRGGAAPAVNEQPERYAPSIDSLLSALCAQLSPEVRNDLRILVEIMTSDNERAKAALHANLVEFQEAVRDHKELKQLRRDVEALKKLLNPNVPAGELGETSDT